MKGSCRLKDPSYPAVAPDADFFNIVKGLILISPQVTPCRKWYVAMSAPPTGSNRKIGRPRLKDNMSRLLGEVILKVRLIWGGRSVRPRENRPPRQRIFRAW